MGYGERNGKFPDGKPKWRAKWQLPERNEKGRHKEGRLDGFRRKKDAEDYANDQEAAIRAGNYIDPNAGKISVAEYFDMWISLQKRRPGTLMKYRQTFNREIKPAWGTTSLCDLRTVPLMQWLAALNDPNSPRRLSGSSIRIIEAILNGMFALAVYEDRIRKSPIPPKEAGGVRGREEFKEKREGEIFTRDEFAALLGNMPTWMHVVFVVTKLFTGLRWSENAAVNRDDLTLVLPQTPGGVIEGTYRVDPKFGAVKLDEKSRPYLGPPKSGGGRLLDLPPFLVLMLADWLTRIPDGQRQLFTAPRGGLLRYGVYLTDVWRPACDGRPAYISPTGRRAHPAILPACAGKVPHDLKHSDKAIMQDGRVHEDMQDYALGHSHQGSSAPYKHPTVQMRRERVEVLQERWLAWAIDLTALPAWGAKDGPGAAQAAIAPAATPAVLQTGQSTLF